MTQTLPLAGTAVLVRDGDAGLEVLMIERPDHGSFAGAWVFPGGMVEPSDAAPGLGDVDDARRAAARETAEEVGLAIEPEDLVPLSRWTPPENPPVGAPKRVCTWFYLGAAADAELALSAAEVVSAAWVRPGDVLQRHGAGRIRLYPPTWVTLHGLAAPTDTAAALADAQHRTPPEFASARRGRVFLWQPDVAYERSAELAASGPRHRLVADSLPWRYEFAP